MNGLDEMTVVLRALQDALREKDAELFVQLGNLPPHLFWVEWKKVYSEDFPQGGLSPAHPSSVRPKAPVTHPVQSSSSLPASDQAQQ